MTPIPPPRKKARESKRPADRAMMVAIAIVAMIGMILGWIIRDVAVRADAEVAEQTVEQTERIELKQIVSEAVWVEPVVAQPTPPAEPTPYYALTEAERYEIEQVVMAEAGGEPYTGQVAVAQCIRDTAIRDSIRPSEVIVEYKYTPDRKEPTQSVQEAVRAVFDDGESAIDTAYYFYAPALVTSKWHESMEFVAELGGHRFFR